ncbi:MAG TPA: VWA domain-containing protein [Terriglobales bacterium]|nr:VWA domain-containing protein [Terriglobales bacterium]
MRTLALAGGFVLAFNAGAQKPVELKGNPPAAQSEASRTPGTVTAQDSKDAKDQDATVSIRSFSRMVLVDVVARDGKGRPIEGLTANDFEILEDGQPQRIISFTHDAVAATPTQSARSGTQMEPAEFVSNQQPEAKAPPSIVVLDLLNTPATDRQFAQQALIKYVKERMRRGETLAIFVLGSKLELLQDFTRDRKVVQAAVDKSQRAVAGPQTAASGANAVYQAADLDGEFRALTFASAERELRNENEAEGQRTITRVNRTLEAMRSLARFGARHQGRKSLVWLSSGFPFFILTDMGMTGFETEMRQTTNLLASTQIAVYPVDVRGLVEVKGKDLEDNLRKSEIRNPMERVDKLTARSDNNASSSDGLTLKSYTENNFNFNQSQDTMKEIADLTGGTAYLNRNDLDVAIASALDENRDIYSLGYYPIKKEFNNRFRKIKVRIKNREVAVLRYRRGYYATGFSVETKANSDLISALENDPSTSPQIALVSRVNPNAPIANQPFKVELFVKGGSIHYTDVAARSAAFLDFAVVALSPNGTPITRTFRRGELKFNKEGLERAEKSGFLYTLAVNLPAGEYKLRAGVRDSFTGRIGTVEIPVVVK